MVAYATKSGSTAEVAQAIAEGLTTQGASVEVRACRDDADPSDYDAVVIGAPILYGKPHEDATRFLRRHAGALAGRPVAVFLTCLELTTTSDVPAAVGEVVVDPQLDRPPAVPGRLTTFERTHLLSTFLEQLHSAAPDATLVSVAVFRGKLDYAGLDPVSLVVMRLIRLLYRRAPAGDHRNWAAIHSWAAGLGPGLRVRAASGNA